jgi:type II secretory pathway component GspD/PulD (secretin)
MKKIFKTAIVFAVFSLLVPLALLNAETLPIPGGPAPKEPMISLDFQDAGLKDVLKIFSIQSGLNFIASEGVQDRKLTLYMDSVPLSQAMDKIFKANNLSYDLDRDAGIFIVKDWGKVTTETITKVFYLKHATVSSSSLKSEMSNQLTSTDVSFSTGSTSSSSSSSGSSGGTGKYGSEQDAGITKAIKKLLSKEGSIIEDFRTNSLVITDTPVRMAVITQVIAALDVPVPQVLLEVEMLDVSKNVVDKLGFSYGTSPFTAVLTGATAATGFPYGSWSKIFSPGQGSLAINSPAANAYSVTLDYLRNQTDTKFLARPKILTLSNETAEIRIATNEAIGVTTTTEASTATTNATPERSETGVILRVTPQVNQDTGEITMFVYPKVSEATAGNSFTSAGATYQFRDPEERSTKSMVRIRDGDTVVLGGLIRNEFLNQRSGLPVLQDIPLIGALFRHTGGTSSSPDKNKQRELLVFITPRIVKDDGSTSVNTVKLAQNTRISLPEREQSLDTGLEREMAINQSLNNFDKRKKQ